MIKRRLAKLEKGLVAENIKGVVPWWDLPTGAIDCEIIELMGHISNMDLLTDEGKKLAHMAHLSFETNLPCYAKTHGPAIPFSEEERLTHEMNYAEKTPSEDLRPYVKSFDTLQADLMECYRRECQELEEQKKENGGEK